MGDVKKDECVICEMQGKDLPDDHKVPMAFGLGMLASKADSPPPFCEMHEILNASVAAMFGVMMAREKAKAAPPNGAEPKETP